MKNGSFQISYLRALTVGSLYSAKSTHTQLVQRSGLCVFQLITNTVFLTSRQGLHFDYWSQCCMCCFDCIITTIANNLWPQQDSSISNETTLCHLILMRKQHVLLLVTYSDCMRITYCGDQKHIFCKKIHFNSANIKTTTSNMLQDIRGVRKRIWEQLQRV